MGAPGIQGPGCAVTLTGSLVSVIANNGLTAIVKLNGGGEVVVSYASLGFTPYSTETWEAQRKAWARLNDSGLNDLFAADIATIGQALPYFVTGEPK